jgi:hypothetical protein
LIREWRREHIKNIHVPQAAFRAFLPDLFAVGRQRLRPGSLGKVGNKLKQYAYAIGRGFLRAFLPLG